MSRPFTVRGSPDFASGPLSPLFSVPGLSFLGVSRRRSPYRGQQWVLTYESFASTDPTLPSAAEEGYLLVPLDFSAELEALGPVYRLTVTTPDIPSGGSDGVHNTYFELLGNALQFDLREHPKALSLETTLSASANRIKLITDYINGADGATAATATAGLTNVNGKLSDAQTLIYLMQQRGGNATFQRSQYVFRCTRVASNRATVDVGYSNVEKILTTAQVIAETGPPAGILAAIADAVTNATPTDVPDGYQFGWLKQTPTVTTTADNLLQIVSEYWLESWSTWIYATATS